MSTYNLMYPISSPISVLAGARSKIDEFQEAALAELEGYGTEVDMLRTIIRSASWQA